jgi:ketosteroid isomerase-like protein
VREWAREGDEAFDELRLTIDEVRDAGPVVLALGRIEARGGASGVALDAPNGWVLWVRDERIAALHGFLDHAAAIEAAARAGEGPVARSSP